MTGLEWPRPATAVDQTTPFLSGTFQVVAVGKPSEVPAPLNAAERRPVHAGPGVIGRPGDDARSDKNDS